MSPGQALQLANLGTAASRNVGIAAGNVVELNALGQFPASTIPGGGGGGSGAPHTGPTFNVSRVYDPVVDAGKFTQFDVATQAVELTLPDATALTADVDFTARVNSAANLASITVAVPGQLRSDNGRVAHDNQANRLFIGFSQNSQPSQRIRVWSRSGQYQVQGQFRENAADDIRFDRPGAVTATQLADGIGRYANGDRPNNFTFTQDDENNWINWSGGVNASLPLLAGGTQIVGERNALTAATIVLLGGLTSPDGLTIPAGSKFGLVFRPGTSVVRVFVG